MSLSNSTAWSQAWAKSGQNFCLSDGNKLYVEIGCYTEGMPRDISYDRLVSDDMDFDKCAQHCSERVSSSQVSHCGPYIAQIMHESRECPAFQSFLYAGVQRGTECRCSLTFGKYGSASASRCNTPCPGKPDRMCGGETANVVLEILTLKQNYGKDETIIWRSSDQPYPAFSLQATT